jgi:UDP-N-acetylglucosamine 3-dehydrogenase
MAALRAAVVGLRFGLAHARAYQNNPHVELAALCDIDPRRLAEAAAHFPGSTVTGDFEQIVADTSIDLVTLATPDHLHAEQSVALLQAGKCVLCEKPMATSHEQLQAMIAAAEQTGKTLYIGQETRLVPIFCQARQRIEDGTLGRIYYAESCYVHNIESLARGTWRADPARPQDAMLGGGCHPVDLLIHLLGPIREVFAYANHFNADVLPQDDCIAALYRFESGAIGRVLVAVAGKIPYRLDLHLYGTAGSLVANNEDPVATVWRAEAENPHVVSQIRASGDSHPIQEEVDTFVRCVLDRSPPFVDAYQGASAAAACLAAVESARTGRPVTVRRYDRPSKTIRRNAKP